MEGPLHLSRTPPVTIGRRRSPLRASSARSVDDEHSGVDDVIPFVRRRSHSSLSSVGWLPKDDIDAGEWEAQGRWLGSIGRCSQWWIGDWVRFGTARYGEKYDLAAKLTGYDEHSLRNMAYVASRFPDLSQRRKELSFSHHAELAALDPSAQQRWLNWAQSRGSSVLALRRTLAERRASERPELLPPEGEEPDRGEDDAGATLTCPSCGHRFKQ